MPKMNKDLAEIDMAWIERNRRKYLYEKNPKCRNDVLATKSDILTPKQIRYLIDKLKGGYLRFSYDKVSWAESVFILCNSNAYLDADEQAIIVKPMILKST